MRVYRKIYRCNENFPVAVDQEWNVTEGKRIAEHWHVIDCQKTQFTVEIKEYIPQ